MTMAELSIVDETLTFLRQITARETRSEVVTAAIAASSSLRAVRGLLGEVDEQVNDLQVLQFPSSNQTASSGQPSAQFQAPRGETTPDVIHFPEPSLDQN